MCYSPFRNTSLPFSSCTLAHVVTNTLANYVDYYQALLLLLLLLGICVYTIRRLPKPNGV